jgi:hypothetical protein
MYGGLSSIVVVSKFLFFMYTFRGHGHSDRKELLQSIDNQGYTSAGQSSKCLHVHRTCRYGRPVLHFALSIQGYTSASLAVDDDDDDIQVLAQAVPAVRSLRARHSSAPP